MSRVGFRFGEGGGWVAHEGQGREKVRDKEEAEKNEERKTEEKEDGFLHSWFMYSESHIYRLSKADVTCNDTGPLCLSRSSDITVNLTLCAFVHWGGGGVLAMFPPQRSSI